MSENRRYDEVDVLEMLINDVLEQNGWEIYSKTPYFSDDKTSVQIWIRKEYKEGGEGGE
jgi:hypothetical protein